MGVSARFCGVGTKQNDVVWAAWHARVLASACRAWLAFKPGSKHTCLTGTAGRFVPRNLSVACLLVPDCRMTRLCSTTTFCRSPPRPRPRELNLGRHTRKPTRTSFSDARMCHPRPALAPPLPTGTGSLATHRANAPPIITLPPMLPRLSRIAWPLARPHPRA